MFNFLPPLATRGKSLADKEQSSAMGDTEKIDSNQIWEALIYYVTLPSVGMSILNVFLKLHHGEYQRPKFWGRMAYPHLHIRSKPFSWGDGNHTLFHNSHMNPFLTSYENEQRELGPQPSGDHITGLDP
uniref:Cytochrome c oxidase subunit n=1 Tax=Canis lupus dingo TaxID=286419 RepID=A0A8C0JMT6_CANLU